MQDTDRTRPYGEGFCSLYDLMEMAHRAENLEELAPSLIELIDGLLMIRDQPLRVGHGLAHNRVFAHNIEIVQEPCEGVTAWLNISFTGTFGRKAQGALDFVLYILGIELLPIIKLIRCGSGLNDSLVPVLFPRDNWPNLCEHSTERHT